MVDFVRHKRLSQQLTTSYSKSDEDKDREKKAVSISIKLVEGTKCEDIQFLVYAKKTTIVQLKTTAGGYKPLGTRITDVKENVTFSGSNTASLGSPGIVSLQSMTPVGSLLEKTEDGKLVTLTGNLICDLEASEIKHSGEKKIYGIVEVEYSVEGYQYGFIWPADKKIKDAIIVASVDAENQSSLTVSRADCEKDDETSGHDNTKSENTQLQFNLSIELGWSAFKTLGEGTHSLYGLLRMYPVHSAGIPDLRVSFGKKATPLKVTFDARPELDQHKELYESVNFSSSSISNLQFFCTSSTDMQIVTESDFFDIKGERVLIPSFKKPGETVIVEEWKDETYTYQDPVTKENKQGYRRKQIRTNKVLGPTEIAHVTATDTLQPVIGVARVKYKVPMVFGVMIVAPSITEEDLKEWFCELHGSYVYKDDKMKPVVFTGKVSIPNQLTSSPALDAREFKLRKLYMD